MSKTKTYDLSTIKDMARPIKTKGISAERERKARGTIRDYEEAGFYKVSKELDEKLTKQLKLSNLATQGYQMLEKKHFEQWLKKIKEVKPKKTENNGDDSGFWISMDGTSSFYATGYTTTASGTIFIDNSTSVQWNEEEIREVPARNPREIASRRIEMGEKTYEVGISEISVEHYNHAPPSEVLKTIRKMKNHNLFDTLVVIYPTCKEVVKDPLLCGKIDGERDKWFYITEWGNDLKIDDLI